MNISIEQTNDLFQKLSTLTSSSSSSSILPDEITESIQEIKTAQKKFLNIVDRFVHNVDDVTKVNVVKDVIETCPQFLSSRNKHGLLPIHTACFRDSCSVYVPLFAKMGRDYGVGGDGKRGGLLEMTSKGNNTYELLAGSTDAIYKDDQCLVETMKILMMENSNGNSSRGSTQDSDTLTCSTCIDALNHDDRSCNDDGPLLFKEELNDSGYLLKALNNERIAMTKFLISLDPMKLYTTILDDKKESTSDSSLSVVVGTWPIHLACNNSANRNESSYKLFCYLLQSGMKYRSLMIQERKLDDHLGGLFAIDSRTNESTFELAIRAFGETRTWNCIMKCIPPSSSSCYTNNDYHILQRAVSLPLEYLSGFLRRYPRAYFARDQNGCLPIHHALKNGLEWSTELISIINANFASLSKQDPCSNLYPFALAATGPKYDLSSVFYLLSLHPDHVTCGMKLVNRRKSVGETQATCTTSNATHHERFHSDSSGDEDLSD